MVKLAGKGHVICRMQSTYTDQLAKENSEKALTAADFGVTDDEASSPEQMRKTALNQACSSINLFLDSNVPSFFR